MLGGNHLNMTSYLPTKTKLACEVSGPGFFNVTHSLAFGLQVTCDHIATLPSLTLVLRTKEPSELEGRSNKNVGKKGIKRPFSHMIPCTNMD